MTLKPLAPGPAMVVMGAVMISFSAVFVKWAHVSPTTVGFYRMAVGTLLLFLITAVRRETLWRRPVHLK
ncbi:MAG TPA: hypothetical protein VLT88_16070, partial [Desulfosarcina sp.]|nr:hypothetical protein [Desulfosarcina sp.]